MTFSLPPLSALDLAFIAVALMLIHLARRWMLLYALLALPGTLLHELSHWLVALMLGGRPGALAVVPVRSERGWRLGSVAIHRVRWFNALPIGLAPLALAPIAWFALGLAAGLEADDWTRYAALYVVAITAFSCLPSRADLAIVVSRPLGVLFYLGLMLAAGYLWWVA